jgi:hypothetical protein
LKRLALAVIAVLALALGVGSATAASSGAIVQQFGVSFTLSSTATDGVPGGCPFMPAGVTISWAGTETSITIIRTGADGLTTVQNSSHAFGKATDENGNSYAFDYSNESRVTETASGSGVLTGTMTDHFSLAGNGLELSNGFLATVRFGPGPFDFSAVPINSRGDPIDFNTIAPHCDPL